MFVTQGLSPSRREFLVTFQMKISLVPLSYAETEFDSYNIKQRYQTFSHPTVQEPDGWSEWEDIYTTFKKVPCGKSIDDLYGEEHLGCYIGKVRALWGTDANTSEDFNFLFVNDGWTVTDTGDDPNYYQTRFVWDAFNYRIETRKTSGGRWSDWQVVFATPQYVNEQIAKIPTGGGGSEFRPLAEITADGETVHWTITKDTDGSDLNVNEVYMLFKHAEASGYQGVYINGVREFLRASVSKGSEEYCYFSVKNKFLNGIVGKYTPDKVAAQKTEYRSVIVSYDTINELKVGGYTSNALPAGTTIKIYVR